MKRCSTLLVFRKIKSKPHLLGCLNLKWPPSLSKNVEILEASCITNGIISGTTTLEKTTWQFLKMLSSSALQYTSERAENSLHANTCVWVFIAAFFIRAEKQKQPEYLSTDEGKPNVCSVTQSCLTLYNPMNCSPPGFSVHGIFQARILE